MTTTISFRGSLFVNYNHRIYNFQSTETVIPAINNPSVYVITQADTYHYIRCGAQYMAATNTGVILQNQPFEWFLSSSNVATQSNVDLLEPEPFYLISGANPALGVIIASNGQGIAFMMASSLNAQNLITLSIQEQSQPYVDATRYLTNGTYSPSASGASAYVATGNVTINGFNAGVNGQTLTIYAINSAIITLNNLSGAVNVGEQIVTTSGGPETSQPGGSFQLIYNIDTAHWIVLTQMAEQSGTTLPLANGTVSAPSLSFADDSETGLYRNPGNAGYIRVTNRAINTVNFTMTGIMPAADATFAIGAMSLRFFRYLC